jgi:molecular chaperone DnaK (HSP70)
MQEITPRARAANIIGIDLGASETRVARINEAGLPEIVMNDVGEPSTPSVIQFESSQITFGYEAKKHLGLGNPHVFSEFKRDLGTDKSWRAGGRTVTPVNLSALLLKKVVDDYAREFGLPDKIAITWPANFRSEQREAVKSAAEGAGLSNVVFVEEPVAAVLYYATKLLLKGKILLYHFGGTTFNVTLIEADGLDIKILYQDGVQQLGGKDMDRVLLKIIAEKYLRKTGKELDGVDCCLGQMEIESFKRLLNTSDTIRVKLISSNHGLVLLEISRNEFNSGIIHLITQAEMACENVLRRGSDDPSRHVRHSDISEILMTGDACLTPAVQSSIEQLFKKTPKLIEPAQAAALGAAIFAAMRHGKAKLNPTPIAPHFFGTSLLREDGAGIYNDIVIKKGVELPCRVERTYHTVKDNQTHVNCDMTQSAIEESNPEFVSILWKGSLQLPPGLPAGSAINVTFSCDIDGCAGMQVSLPEGGGPSATFSANTAPTPPPLADAR